MDRVSRVLPFPQVPTTPSIIRETQREDGVDAGDWGRLMAAAQSGDAGAYRRLLLEVQSWLQRYYERRLPPGAVDDAVQEAMVAVHDKRHSYDPARPFGPWLAAIARFKWIDRLRAMKRNAADPLVDDIAIASHEAAVTTASVLGRLMGELKPAQAEAIRLVKLQGFSISEASAQTGQSVSLVKVNIHRGLARLVRLVQEDPNVE